MWKKEKSCECMSNVCGCMSVEGLCEEKFFLYSWKNIKKQNIKTVQIMEIECV